MPLHLLPIRSAGAAENMAADFLLLKRYPETGDATAARFRHYGWHRPAFTFGYSQKIAAVRAQLPGCGVVDPVSSNRLELCRRPTGGGVVDHRDDWTYALVIPRGHDLEAARAIESYRAIHQALADALAAQGANVRLQDVASQPGAAAFLPLPDTGNSGDALLSIRRSDRNAAAPAPAPAPAAASVCFVQAEPFDVIDARTGQKIAGAAQKRTKNGLLFQGSVRCPAVEAALTAETSPLPPPSPSPASASSSRAFDRDAFYETFTAALARVLRLEAEETPWPDFADGELDALAGHYASPEWNAFR